ncbi:MAG: hypothetical protein D6768_00620 [Chloroflexi bacterium]|nr:MAG: hypothetical protein D6768_00620 [Chloroflexota bacterium]
MVTNNPAQHHRQNSKCAIQPAIFFVLATLVLLLVNPTVTQAQEPVKPVGSGEGTITLWFPVDSVDVPVTVTADYILEDDLPKGIKYPPHTVGQAFTMGVWQGEGTTVDRFSPSVVINVEYADSNIIEMDREQEDKLQLFMYEPVTKSWNRLCSSVDIYENIVSAALTYPTPFEKNGSSLFAIALDQTPELGQTVDGNGTTTLTLKGTDLRLKIARDELPPNSHFAVTMLPRSAGGRSVKLFSRPVDIKACRIDYTDPTRGNRQINTFYRLPEVGFDYDADTLSRAGGLQNLTIANLQNEKWVDVEEFGSRVRRGSQTISVPSWLLGTFGLTVR